LPILITRADLESVRGPQFIAEILRKAGDEPANQTLAINFAMDEAEGLVFQFLTVDEATAGIDVIKPLLVREAIRCLKVDTDYGMTEAEHLRHEKLISALEHMRKNKRFQKQTAKSEIGPSTIVASNDPFSFTNIRGYL